MLPTRVDVLYARPPLANVAIIALTCLVSLVWWAVPAAGELLDGWVLGEGNVAAVLGHLLLHNGPLHLAGNMLALWVFGNAVNANIGSLRYVLIYLLAGMLAALAHSAIDGTPAVGASGAINGIVGVAVAIYTFNDVRLFYFFGSRGGFLPVALWKMAVVWFLLDLWGALSGSAGVAYWAHLGGLVGGILVGLYALDSGWVILPASGRRTLRDLWRGEGSGLT